MSELGALLQAQVRRFKTQTALAEAIGISQSRLGRVMRGEYSLEVANCLRLAKVAGERPSVVLRAAGKADVAELIEETYGPGRVTLSKTERDLLDKWAAIPADMREPFRTLIDLAAKPGVKRKSA